MTEHRPSQNKPIIDTCNDDESGVEMGMKKRSSQNGRQRVSPTTVAGFGEDYDWKDEGYSDEMEEGEPLINRATSPGRRRKSLCNRGNDRDNDYHWECSDDEKMNWEIQRSARISERNRKRGQRVLFVVILSLVSMIVLMDEEMPLANMLERRLTEIPASTATSDPWHPIYRPHFHSSSFNGLTCPPSVSESSEELSSEVSALNLQNIVNQYGRYHHTEFQSPYAAPEIHATDAQKEQRLFLDKLKAIREEWGAWDFRDFYMSEHDGQPRPEVTDFATTPYRDVPAQTFPHDSWQTDGTYVRQLIREGLALVRRVKLAVYSEFDHPNLPRRSFWKPFWPFRRPLSPAQRQERDYVFRVRNDYDEEVVPEDGIAEMSKESWEGLVRKMLHALMTNDEFYVVVAGHGSTAGYGNNFDQSQTMVFHRLMEPVFDKLGVRLVSRNMAVGEGTSGKEKGSKSGGTIPSALGGTDIFGPSDILWWDGADADMDLGPTQDFFHRQAILSAKDRIPFLLSSFPGSISEMTNHLALSGHFVVHTAPRFLPKTTSVRQARHLPFATQFLFCNRPRDPLCTKEHKYNAVCWVNRTDIEPPKSQRAEPAGRSQWHSGHKFHHFQGRLLSLIVLQALEAALERWEEGIRAEGVPLADKYWHVQDLYQSIEKALQDNIKPKNKKKKKSESAEEDEETPQSKVTCENLFPPSLQRLCHVPLRAFTDWTPRAVPQKTSLLSIVRRSPVSNYKPKLGLYLEYYGPDVVSPQQRLPDHAVDAHAIALVTTEGASPFAARPRCEDESIPFHVRGEGEKARRTRNKRPGRMEKHRKLSSEESENQGSLEKDDDGKDVDRDGNEKENEEESDGGKEEGEEKENTEVTTEDEEPDETPADEVDNEEDLQVEGEGAKTENSDEKQAKGGSEEGQDNGDEEEATTQGGGNDVENYPGTEMRNEEQEEERSAHDESSDNTSDATDEIAEERGSYKDDTHEESDKSPSAQTSNNSDEGDSEGADEAVAQEPVEDSEQGTTPRIAGGHGWSLQDAFVGFCDGSSNAECNRHRGKTCLMAGFNDSRGGLVGDAFSGWLVLDVPDVQRGLIVVRLEYGGKLVGSNRRTRGWTELNDGLFSDEGVATEKFFQMNAGGDDDEIRDGGQVEIAPYANIELSEGTTESADDDGDEERTRRLVESETALNVTEDSGEDLGGDDEDSALDDDIPDDFLFDFGINGQVQTWDKVEFLSRAVKVRRSLKLWTLLNDAELDAQTVEVAVRVRSAHGRMAVIKLSHLYYS